MPALWSLGVGVVGAECGAWPLGVGATTGCGCRMSLVSSVRSIPFDIWGLLWGREVQS